MKKKQIKQIVNDAFNEETPDFLSKIKSECSNIRQVDPVLYEVKESKNSFRFSPIFKKLAFGMVACVLFVTGLFIGNIEPTIQVAAKEASIYLDVNPSIEIQVDENNNVIECVAGNDDGVKILENITLEGVEIDTALYAIVGSMYTNGYLNAETNSILVSVDSYNNDDTILLNDISNQIDNVFKENEDMNCSIIAQKVESDDDLREKATEHKISIGKMHLIEKIIAKNDLYTEDNIDELAEMSIHELDLIYQSLGDNIEEGEIISGKPGGFIGQSEALNYVLEYLEITEDDIRWYDVIALFHHNENQERKMIYLVTIILNDEEERTKYIVDCATGEIMPEETVDEWKDKIPNDGSFGGPKDENGPNNDFDGNEEPIGPSNPH